MSNESSPIYSVQSKSKSKSKNRNQSIKVNIPLVLLFAQIQNTDAKMRRAFSSSTTTIAFLTFTVLTLTQTLASCGDAENCNDCASGKWDCAWCESTGECLNGSLSGPSGKCQDWRVGQCLASNLIIYIGAGVSVLLLSFIICCCCCKCCSETAEEKRFRREYQALFGEDPFASPSGTPKRSSTAQAMYAKYAKYRVSKPADSVQDPLLNTHE